MVKIRRSRKLHRKVSKTLQKGEVILKMAMSYVRKFGNVEGLFMAETNINLQVILIENEDKG